MMPDKSYVAHRMFEQSYAVDRRIRDKIAAKLFVRISEDLNALLAGVHSADTVLFDWTIHYMEVRFVHPAR